MSTMYNNASYVSLFVMKIEKLLVNSKITAALCQRIMSSKYYIQRYKQQQPTLKHC